MRISKRYLVFALGVLLLGVPAQAAINPASPGLPPANAYTLTGLLNNAASAMCVDCHSRNPARYTNPTFAGNYAPPTAADVKGSHYVMESYALAHSGGGWSDDRWLGTQYINGKYMKVDAWGLATDTNFSAGWSKWSNSTPASVPAYSTGAPTPITAGQYGIICESCHNILINAPGPGVTPPQGNRKLLAWSSNNQAQNNSYLCEGCHARMKATATAGNNDGGNFNGATAQLNTGRDHHVLGGDSITAALSATGRLWGRSWAWLDTTAQMGNPVEPTTYANFIRPDALTTGDIDFAAANSTQITCSSCHRAHNAQTSTGALILKSGNGTNLVGTGLATDGGTGTNYGIQRQFDRGAKEVSTTKLVTNESNLCDGCHSGYR